MISRPIIYLYPLMAISIQRQNEGIPCPEYTHFGTQHNEVSHAIKWRKPEALHRGNDGSDFLPITYHAIIHSKYPKLFMACSELKIKMETAYMYGKKFALSMECTYIHAHVYDMF